ncbi:MAG: type I DNA topoisomerase [Desulfobacula sp.]|uniref:type I DNA topoisomerase n=1 Tax=Desulfobacula sp. TaxID=2593537 RepID=UPI001D9CCB3A|nr:type I DNA topoisomerase [Desulfobacula sp.]MBT3487312.1 type I DNA topoisomerase [Desulfobacula sp.]MBT3805078.1 type I DNA topoisomerase [Desulfobacula sp.]MBT4025580.1 type I DNA topoisomerase [Desulfobacula sp.]MBT4199692.1 type I DNA topoisomerase [Desulfobacula sp.]
MTKPLIIVESPTKIKTLKKYVGKEFNIGASAGHIRDLPVKTLGIDIEKKFKAKYVNIKDKAKIIANLKKLAKGAKEIYLAPDPDREGEAIAFHIMDILKGKEKVFHRVLIHELTKKGIQEALKQTLKPDVHKYDAQQARRKLDRLVGYQISPLLWQKVQRGLSAGRVQSVTVKIICDRERQIRKFVPEEFWTITADLLSLFPPQFNAALIKINNKKAKIENQKQASGILRDLENAQFVIHDIKSKTIKRNPAPPFITSKLQQDAINRLKFSARKTMIVAQQLYEGIEIGTGGPEGLITYMRTDSTRIASDAAEEAQKFISKTLGNEFALSKPRFFKNKNKVQDAHEAIRPTSVFNSPKMLKKFLSPDQFNLYTLIWNRFVASQMTQSIIDQKTILIQATDQYLFSVSGSTVRFPGFMKLYSQDQESKEKEIQVLPDAKIGTALKTLKINPKQHFTKPLPRFSEASLVKELEKNGIGRPSTYASILTVIRDKGYVDLIKRYFIPSELGFIVNDLLAASFPNILNISFTAQLETNLDDVETGNLEEVQLLTNFYATFKQSLDAASENMVSVKGVGVDTDLKCPSCKKQLNIKIGKNGHFLACTGYPDCSFTSNYLRDEKGNLSIVEKIIDNTKVKDCIKCGQPMVQKEGRFGLFLACTGYPDCKHTESVNGGQNGKDIGVKCPQTDCSGSIVERKSKRGKIFFGCSNYPDCTFASWDKPVDKSCPDCNSAYLVEKETKRDGKSLKCPNKDCSFKEQQ